MAVPDHPRSRGVYGRRILDTGVPLGSSPLARGLRPFRVSPCSRYGIIPARAGFTDGASHSAGGAPDHPRSRGVYLDIKRYREARAGSSPLARGLHLRIPGIPTMSHATRPRLPSVPT